MPPTAREQFGRPSLQTILDRQNASATIRYVAQQILRASPLLQLMPFDDSTVANARQRSVTYSYKRRRVARVAQLREFNTDYKPGFSKGEEDAMSYLRPIGDAFEIDRVFGDADPEYVDEQIQAMAPAITSKFCDLGINGDRGTSTLEFDGLNAITEDIGGTAVVSGLSLAAGDGGTAASLALRQNLAKLNAAIRAMRSLNLTPVVLANADTITALELAADVYGQRREVGSFYDAAPAVTTISGAALVDVGVTNVLNAADVATPPADGYRVEAAEIIPTVAGVTDLYVVGMSRVNGLTGVTLNGQAGTTPVRYSTNPTDAGALRRYELEIVAGIALLDERAAVKFSDVTL